MNYWIICLISFCIVDSVTLTLKVINHTPYPIIVIRKQFIRIGKTVKII